MKIVVLGWYGTETLGDRAILYGLMEIFEKTFGQVGISIGSIYPFFTERSLYEDEAFLSLCAPMAQVSYFDVKNKEILNSEILGSDLVIMGGGPIMDLNDLGIIEYGFGIAKKNKIKTALLGCGIGPLFKKKFQKTSLKLLKQADLVILRDEVAKRNILELEKINNFKIDKDVYVTFDPAILPVRKFIENYGERKIDNNIAINFREFPKGNFQNVDTNQIDKLLINTLEDISKHYEKIILFPMHTFSVGGDDRYYLSKLIFRASSGNIKVLDKPMCLWELFELVYNSNACIGMRYHSVVFQSLLNGNNLIFDYTEASKGKISGFLDIINGKDFYYLRYINIQSLSHEKTLNIESLLEENKFNYPSDIFDRCQKTFCNNLKVLF
ncbi:MAG: polysaccharide pyruvyl transferase family protein [Bacillota bacterium]